jgi:hypothetical protein
MIGTAPLHDGDSFTIRVIEEDALPEVKPATKASAVTSRIVTARKPRRRDGDTR